jgi:TatD DNase family protein
LVRAYPNKLRGALGIHPWYCDDVNVDLMNELREILVDNPDMLIGEIGLDALKKQVSAKQHEVFSGQLSLALELNRAVVIHGARAFDELKMHKNELCEVKFSYHGFVKNRELIKFVNDCDGYFGLSDLFLRQEKAREFWDMMPKNRILFETDAPYRVKESEYLDVVGKNMLKLEEISGIKLEDLENLLMHNAMEFFDAGR